MSNTEVEKHLLSSPDFGKALKKAWSRIESTNQGGEHEYPLNSMETFLRGSVVVFLDSEAIYKPVTKITHRQAEVTMTTVRDEVQQWPLMMTSHHDIKNIYEGRGVTIYLGEYDSVEAKTTGSFNYLEIHIDVRKGIEAVVRYLRSVQEMALRYDR